MTKKSLLLCFFIIGSFTLKAQEVISSNGGSYVNDSLYIDFTIGEPIIETVGNSSFKLTQGFHQANLVVVDVEVSSELSISLFPNPVLFQLHLSIEVIKENYTYDLIDINGKTVLSQRILNELTTIDVNGIASGIYILNVNNEKQEIIETFKVIKTD